jgi:hypothetical protein
MEALQAEATHEAASTLIPRKRDAFIAERIGATLQEGETGILFLGILHNLSAVLLADIQVRHPVKMPSHRGNA